MSVYRVYFKWKNKDIHLTAKNLDLTHPYFVSIMDLVFQKESAIIINPQDDEIQKAFGQTKNLMLPFNSVNYIEELKEEETKKVMPFSLINEKDSE
ncbi:MAG: DUF1820 family protein [Spirochaetales bacterium]|nr:DUF1820 family protein [Spirochaetales bacterium]